MLLLILCVNSIYIQTGKTRRDRLRNQVKRENLGHWNLSSLAPVIHTNRLSWFGLVETSFGGESLRQKMGRIQGRLKRIWTVNIPSD